MHAYLYTTGDPAIAVVDSFHLPYRPAYRRVHSSRTIIVAAADSDRVRVDDCWEPTYRGPLSIKHLDAARRSRAAADPFLEPVFSGVQADAEWYTVSVEPLPIADAPRWAVTTIGALVQEITEGVHAAGGRFGLAALRDLTDALADGGTRWPHIPRRTVALVLRAELSSRRYLCPLLRNAVMLAGLPELIPHVDVYQHGLRHFEAARDVLIKTLRHDRAEYDEYLLARCRDVVANEERLLAAIVAAGLPAAPVTVAATKQEAGAWPG